MNTFRFAINKHYPFSQAISERMAMLMHVFGLTMFRLEKMSFHHLLDVTLRPGDICYITGESGAGKSVLLREMEKLTPENERINLADISLDDKRSLIDSVDLYDGSLFETLNILSAAGLSDALAMLTRPSALSTGQVFRYRLARALLSQKKYIFADEFLNSADRLAAMVICSNLRRVAREGKHMFIFASSHSDLIVDLQPDVVVVKYANGTTDIRYRDPARQKGLKQLTPKIYDNDKSTLKFRDRS